MFDRMTVAYDSAIEFEDWSAALEAREIMDTIYELACRLEMVA